MEVLYHIRPYFVGIFPYIGLIYGRYLQFRFLKWPLNQHYQHTGSETSKSVSSSQVTRWFHGWNMDLQANPVWNLVGMKLQLVNWYRLIQLRLNFYGLHWFTILSYFVWFQDLHSCFFVGMSSNLCWLVVWNIFIFSIYIGNVIIPTDFHNFQRDWNHQPGFSLTIINHILTIINHYY